MSDYIKPSIMLVASGASNAAASSCSTSTKDATEIKNILISMGYKGKEIGLILDKVLEKVINETLKNDFKEICDYVSSAYKPKP